MNRLLFAGIRPFDLSSVSRCYRPSSLVQGVPIPWGVWAESHQFSRGTNNLICKAHANVDRNVGSTERFLGSWNSRNFARYGGLSQSQDSRFPRTNKFPLFCQPRSSPPAFFGTVCTPPFS